MAAMKTSARWNIKNNLKNVSLEVALYRRGDSSPRFEDLSPGETKIYRSLGNDGRIELRIQKPHRYRVEFGKEDFPGWVELNPNDQKFSTLMFPNGGEHKNDNEERAVTIHPPE